MPHGDRSLGTFSGRISGVAPRRIQVEYRSYRSVGHAGVGLRGPEKRATEPGGRMFLDAWGPHATPVVGTG